MAKKKATNNPSLNPRRDKPVSVSAANKKMHKAWTKGKQLINELDMRAGYGAMKKMAKEDVSLAEKYRKYRSMANRITEFELNKICGLCEEHGRAWGPSFLVELSRLPKYLDRRKMAKQAIQDRWGLIELQRRVRRILGPQNYARNAGRKRLVDLTDKADILDQINSLCVGWSRFANQLEPEDTEAGSKVGLEILPTDLQGKFTESSKLIAALKQQIENDLKQP